MSKAVSFAGNSGRTRRLIRACLFLVAVLSCAAVSAKEATFLMMDGKQYDRVNYRVLRDYKAVEIELEKKKVNISFADIAAIYDLDGNDITRSTIGLSSRPAKQPSNEPERAPADTSGGMTGQMETDNAATPPSVAQSNEPWVSKTNRAYQESNKNRWGLLFSTFGSMAIPTGDYYEGINPGFGAEGEIIVPVAREVGIGLNVSWHSLSTDWNDLSVTLMRYFLVFAYLNEMGRGMKIFYATTGLGANTLSAGGYSETNFTIPVTFGIILPAGKTIGINLGMGLDMNFVPGVDKDGNDGTASAYELNLRAGFAFGIPR